MKSVLTINAPEGSSYEHINFPKKNFMMKRGTIVNYNALDGKKVIVKKITKTVDESSKVNLQRADGLNFFRFYPTVKADLDKALASGELKHYKGKAKVLKGSIVDN